MHNSRRKPPHYDNFKEYGEQHQPHREPSPQEVNSAQLFNWLADIKKSMDDIKSPLTDYRLRHADERMHMREFMTNMAKDRSNTAALLEAIVDHLTTPQQPVDRRNPIENNALPNFEIPAEEIKQSHSMLEAARQMMPAAVEQAMPLAIDNAMKPNKRKVNRLKGTNLEDFLFSLLLPGEIYDSEIIWAAIELNMPGHNISRTSIMPTLSRLTAAGKLERVERGKYRVLKS